MANETRNRVPCTGCSLLCDDLAIEVQGGVVAKVHNACLRGSKRFHFASSKDRLRSAWVSEGHGTASRAVSVDAAIDACRALLEGAKNPAITGLAKLAGETQAIVVEVARRHGATVFIDGLDAYKKLQAAASRQGISTSTLGEAINNADLLVFWGANVVDRSPKLLVKAVFSRGRYRQTGKEGKKLAVIDDHRTPTMERADIKIDTGTRPRVIVVEALVKALVHTGVLDAAATSEISGRLAGAGTPGDMSKELVDATSDLASAIKDAEYPVIFLGEELLRDPASDGMIDAVLALAAKVRASVVPVFYSTNIAGAFHETCMAGDVLAFTDLDGLASNNHDVILAFGSDFVSKLPAATVKQLKDTTIIAVDYKDSPTTRLARVFIPTCMTGVECGELATRYDGITLRLAPPVQAPAGLVDDGTIATRLLGP